ncbi:Transcriptional regulator [Amycolatopsis camponoti]|uniref:Transcriptional regulator n=1 Tax=Amycolatopsis camponoti TaxID=2606593 RepID=A0A6I8M5V1_9PSEU|nr:TetR family transcriptional regulator [Amycolatopsis camponoti]VVJ23013.1 Transcriptional regulator [Amycolatopsis camponoti]
MTGNRLTRAESRERTKDRLLAAAAELFAERGVNGTSVEQIADRAGYTRGAFYGNFEDKHELVVALLERSVPGVLRSELVLHAVRDPAVRPHFDARERSARAVVETRLRADFAARGVAPPASPAFLALVVRALEDGLLLHGHLNPEAGPDALAEAVRLLLRP